MLNGLYVMLAKNLRPSASYTCGYVLPLPNGGPTTPVESRLLRRQTGLDLNLEGNDVEHISFDGRVVYRNPFRGTRLSEDDVAVADLLELTGAWARGEGPEPYPLAEGLQDHRLSLAIEESVATGRVVATGTEAWAG